MALPKSILLIITGSVASYKALELIRLLSAEGTQVHAILTKGGAQFITPLAVSSLTGTKTYDDLFSLTDEVEMGHIELSRIADVVLVAPASADILAKMANGIADDLATTALLATNKPVIVAPAMNHKMWSHAATQRNIAQLKKDGIAVIDPTEGAMACGEFGVGRLAEPTDIVAFLKKNSTATGPLAGKKAVVTSGPTYEPIDPVRFLGNRSSGKQGHAIAAALAAAGADVTLVSGPTTVPAPAGVKLVSVTTGKEMLHAVEAALPADLFVAAAAVADWRPTHVAGQKIKKNPKLDILHLDFIPTDDILASIAQSEQRPALVVGFAAESEQVRTYAKAKRMAKGADWILANDISGDVFGSDSNEILFITGDGEEALPRMSKTEVAELLVNKIATHFSQPKSKKKNAS
jgi:phosphopantothenoylcysteine decarboxylase/phosphopantothenate--cysteine ligase